ncbi:MAG: outer membrane lipoprotein carrier protein LolA [Paludibacteraceae bacterium]|nr:outer membrane lipoprotein carrier protein LolA [Paludibacteraceae bacterium]
MRKFFVSILLSLPCLLTNATAATLDTFLQTLAENTLQSDFVITISEGASQPMNYPGTITMRGDRFALEMFDMEAAYDGKTLYVYSATTDELTLSTPTEKELMEANPFLYAQALSKVCTITEQPSTGDAGVPPAGRKQGGGANTTTNITITLTPNDQTAGIQRFTLRIQKDTMLPLSVEVKEGKQQTTLRLTNPTYTTNIPSFTLTKPDAFLNDLR